jgi:hypothetical protein
LLFQVIRQRYERGSFGSHVGATAHGKRLPFDQPPNLDPLGAR